MSALCHDIATAVAADVALSEVQQQHADQCSECAALIELPRGIATASEVRAVAPGPGFASRVTRGALDAMSRRKRTRVASLAVAAAGATALIIGITTLRPARDSATTPLAPAPAAAVVEATDTIDPTPIDQLLSLSDIDNALSYQADWEYIEQPLTAIRLLAGDLQ